MKALLSIILFFVCFNVSAQWKQNDTTKYVWYKYQYGSRMPRMRADSVQMIPFDTTFSKDGIAKKGNSLYLGNGTYWNLINSSTQVNYNGIDSSTTVGNDVCLWSVGVAIVCFTINSTPGDTTVAGIDSVVVQGDILCQWKAGVSTCYTVTNTTVNNSTIINYIDSSVNNVYNYVDSSGSGTIIITNPQSGIDSVTFRGYQVCVYPHDSIVPRCWQLNTFFDDVRLSDDSTLYEFYNGDSLVKTVPSGIKNVGAVWPLSYNGIDLTTSKPFNDSLYLSSLVLHGTSLYSKKLTGDSVLVGTITGSGSSGITKVGSPAFGLTRTNDSTYIVDTAVIASQARLSAMLALKLNITDTANMRFRPIAGTNVTLSGTYPNITITAAGSGSGTVTSIATGIGLSGGTITSSGTIIADTTVLTSQTRTTAGLALKQNVITTSGSTIVATASQTAFTFTAVPSSYTDYDIFVNGSRIEPVTYFTTSGNIVTFTTGLAVGDRVQYVKRL